MQSERTRKLVYTAVFSALILVMTFIPYTGYIKVGPVEITTLHIPVIAAGILMGPMYGTIIGGVWGATCILNAFIINPVFTNPMISLVPRLIVGLVAAWVYVGLSKVIKNRVVCCAVTAVAGTLTNTLLVITALGLFASDSLVAWFGVENAAIQNIFTVVLQIIAGSNGLIELAAAVVLVPVIVMAIQKARKKS